VWVVIPSPPRLMIASRIVATWASSRLSRVSIHTWGHSRSGSAQQEEPSMKKRNVSRKVLLSLGALGAAGAIAGLGTFATFTSTTSASQTTTAGKVSIALGAVGPANRLTVNATNVVPGDTINRAVDLVNSSTDGLKSVSLTTTATASSILDTDTSTGLKMYIQSCSLSGGWTEAG